jgi:hypothetical protein
VHLCIAQLVIVQYIRPYAIFRSIAFPRCQWHAPCMQQHPQQLFWSGVLINRSRVLITEG